MIAATQLKASTASVRIRPVAVPVEHGGWGLLLEPVVIGLVLSPSLAGVWFSLAAVSAFLMRHPFKLAVVDWRRNRRYQRTALAARFTILYFIIGTLSFAIAIRIAGVGWFLPILIALPFTILQLFYDTSGRSRALMAEVAGSVSVGSIAAALAMAGGWSSRTAFGLWLIVTARHVPTILYLRAKLRLLHGKTAASRRAVVAHLAAVVIVATLAFFRFIPFLPLVAMLVLFLRAVIGFSSYEEDLTAKKLGVRELGFGAMTVAMVIVGYVIWL